LNEPATRACMSFLEPPQEETLDVVRTIVSGIGDGRRLSIRLVNGPPRRSCGVAEVMMSVSERVDNGRATLAPIETCAREPRSATFAPRR
jgi:hypothetical protein